MTTIKEIAAFIPAETPVINNTEDMKAATESLSLLNKGLDKVKEWEKKEIGPLKDIIKTKEAEVKPYKVKLTAMVAAIRTAMSSYQTKKTAEANAEKEKLAARIGEGKGKLKLETAVTKIEAVATPDSKVSTDEGMVSFRTSHVVRVVDKTLIPLEFLTVDESAIKAAIKAGKTVPGAVLDEVQVPVNYR